MLLVTEVGLQLIIYQSCFLLIELNCMCWLLFCRCGPL